MEWLQNNSWIFGLAGLVLAVIVTIIVIIILIKAGKLSSSIVDSSIKMTASLMFDSDDGTEFLNINIFNTSFKDVTIGDFGIDYKNQRFNFVAEYIEAKKITSVPTISARTSINFRFDPQRLEKFILAHNYKSKSVSTIKMFVTDSVGNQFLRKNSALSKVLKERQKQRVRQAKLIVHNNKIDEYKLAHDDREPLTNIIWKMFHSSKSDLEIIDTANSLSERHKFNSTKQIPDVQKNTSSFESSENISKETTTISSSSGEIKMTYLNDSKPRTRKKKVSETSDDSKVKEKENTLQ